MADIQRGFGRKFVIDERDGAFRMSVVLGTSPAIVTGERVLASTGRIFDQGQTPECVGYAMRSLLTWVQEGDPGGPTAHDLYEEAKLLDELGPEDPYTSTRAGLKALQALGYIKNYYWAESVEDVRLWMCGGHGPVVVGSDWHEGMLVPDSAGYIQPSGEVVDGHCYLVDGWSDKFNANRIHQSWGLRFARAGYGLISIPDMEMLLAPDKGEAAGVVR
jgi:hypothetical protein